MKKYIPYIIIILLALNGFNVRTLSPKIKQKEESLFSLLYYPENRLDKSLLIEVNENEIVVYEGTRNTSDLFLEGTLPQANTNLFSQIIQKKKKHITEKEKNKVIALYNNINLNVKGAVLKDGWGILFSTKGNSYKLVRSGSKYKCIDELMTLLIEISPITIDPLDESVAGS